MYDDTSLALRGLAQETTSSGLNNAIYDVVVVSILIVMSTKFPNTTPASFNRRN